ncbi:uncharacterized protein A4U43_C07F29370 [Asparagus officinalis]|uniref:Uncharacterized protein n=1 Tax=Asparagus officinalis TaxID=4686 RepID=A0A5P1EIX1_ASPOF|nr:uncharacterized protein A4U43_C07F29370 [Asparagus officinalis]
MELLGRRWGSRGGDEGSRESGGVGDGRELDERSRESSGDEVATKEGRVVAMGPRSGGSEQRWGQRPRSGAVDVCDKESSGAKEMPPLLDVGVVAL